MKAKRTLALLFAVISIFLICFSGCNTKPKAETIPTCDIPLQTIEQQSLNNYANFKFSVPEGWVSEEIGMLAVATASSEIRQTDVSNPEAWTLYIKNYRYSNWGHEYSEDNIKAYRDLFRGETKSYEAMLNVAIARILQPSDSSFSSDLNMLDFFDSIASAYEDSTLMPSTANEQYITAFNYQLYTGNKGKIAVVEYTVSVQGNDYFMINCIREDIPYLTSGCFDNSLEVSSGDIALWTANSLEVDENFIVEKGKIQKK